MSELHENAPLYEYYLSLIVNNDGKYCAKIAYVGEVTRQFKLKNPGDSGEYSATTEEMLVLVDLDIVKEARLTLPSDTFQERYEKVKEATEATKASKYIYKGYTNSYGTSRYSNNQFNAANSQSKLWEDTEEETYFGWDNRYPTANKKGDKGSKKEFKRRSKVEFPKLGKDNKTKVSMNDKEFDEYLIAWLQQGLDIFPEITYTVIPETTTKLLETYNDFFTEDNTGQYEYFIEQMTKVMPPVFHDVHPNLVFTKGCRIMDEWEIYYGIAADLYNIFDSYVEYIQELNFLKESLKDGASTK